MVLPYLGFSNQLDLRQYFCRCSSLFRSDRPYSCSSCRLCLQVPPFWREMVAAGSLVAIDLILASRSSGFDRQHGYWRKLCCNCCGRFGRCIGCSCCWLMHCPWIPRPEGIFRSRFQVRSWTLIANLKMMWDVQLFKRAHIKNFVH